MDNLKEDSSKKFENEINEINNEQKNFSYTTNSIPLVLKIVWLILISWGIYYSLKYSIPNLSVWLDK